MEYRLDIPEDAWTPTGSLEDSTSRLMLSPAHFYVNGYDMHLEAFAVVRNKKGEQVAADATFADDVDAILTLVQGAAETVTIRGRSYILAATPLLD